jgi:hypothetical protein
MNATYPIHQQNVMYWGDYLRKYNIYGGSIENFGDKGVIKLVELAESFNWIIKAIKGKATYLEDKIKILNAEKS